MDPDEDIFRQRIYELFYDPKSDRLNRIYAEAVREALLMHKRGGNPVPIERDGKLVWLQPDEIEID